MTTIQWILIDEAESYPVDSCTCYSPEGVLCQDDGDPGLGVMQNGVRPERWKRTELGMNERDSQS